MRFCSICVFAQCPEAGLDLASLQLGVGVAGGAQCIGHALRAGAEAHPDHATVATDVRNAFNSIERLGSNTGVRQGDPMGPLLLSLIHI